MNPEDIIKFEKEINQPLTIVFPLLRDNQPLLAPHIPEVESIELQKREKQGMCDRVETRWQGVITEGAKKLRVDPPTRKKMSAWIETATWDPFRRECTWTDYPDVPQRYYQVRGKMQFRPIGRNSTLLSLEAHLEVYPHKVPGLPGLLVPMVSGQLRKGIRQQMGRVMESLPLAVEKYQEQAQRNRGP
jgi:hypothetical protein